MMKWISYAELQYLDIRNDVVDGVRQVLYPDSLYGRWQYPLFEDYFFWRRYMRYEEGGRSVRDNL